MASGAQRINDPLDWLTVSAARGRGFAAPPSSTRALRARRVVKPRSKGSLSYHSRYRMAAGSGSKPPASMMLLASMGGRSGAAGGLAGDRAVRPPVCQLAPPARIGRRDRLHALELDQAPQR